VSRQDKLAAVLGVRERIEKQRQADQAVAHRNREHASATLAAALANRAAQQLMVGHRIATEELFAHRVGIAALGDAVEQAGEHHRAADQAVERTGAALVEAAIARRSVERLRERRLADEREAEAKRQQRRDDEVALQIWRRR
jgi:flagellar export protein FliJ